MIDEEAREPETDGNAMLELVLSLTEPLSTSEAHPGDAVVDAIAEGVCDPVTREAFLKHAERCSPCRKRLSLRIKKKSR